MKKILIINLNMSVDKTAVINKLNSGGVHRLPDVLTMPGGKGINVARVLKSLGLKSEIIGFTAGKTGRWIEAALKKEGLPADTVFMPAQESRVCYSIVETAPRVSTDINEEGPVITAKYREKFLKLYRQKIKKYKAVAFCGRICRELEDGFFAKLIASAKANGLFTGIDTSGNALKRAYGAGAFLMKMNRGEFEESSGKKFTPESVISFFKKLRKSGVNYLVITDGANDVFALTPENFWRLTPPKIDYFSTVGAGDSFMAGLIYGFFNGMNRQDCVKLAVGCAASNCLNLGAGAVKKKEIFEYAKKTKLKRFDFNLKPLR